MCSLKKNTKNVGNQNRISQTALIKYTVKDTVLRIDCLFFKMLMSYPGCFLLLLSFLMFREGYDKARMDAEMQMDMEASSVSADG